MIEEDDETPFLTPRSDDDEGQEGENTVVAKKKKTKKKRYAKGTIINDVARLTTPIKRDYRIQTLDVDTLRPLVDLAYWSTFLEVRRDAAAAFATLCLNAANLEILSQAGALGALLALIGVSNGRTDPRVLRDSASALAELVSLKDIKVRLLKAPEGLPSIFYMSKAPSLEVKRASVKALLQLCEEDSTKEAIVQQGGIRHLQAVLVCRDQKLKRGAARVLRLLASNPRNKLIMADPQECRLLLLLLQDPYNATDSVFKGEMLLMLVLLAGESRTHSALLEAGVLRPLLLQLDLLGVGGGAGNPTGAQTPGGAVHGLELCLLATRCLHSLAQFTENHAQIVEVGVLRSMGRLCFVELPDLLFHAARAKGSANANDSMLVQVQIPSPGEEEGGGGAHASPPPPTAAGTGSRGASVLRWADSGGGGGGGGGGGDSGQLRRVDTFRRPDTATSKGGRRQQHSPQRQQQQQHGGGGGGGGGGVAGAARKPRSPKIAYGMPSFHKGKRGPHWSTTPSDKSFSFGAPPPVPRTRSPNARAGARSRTGTGTASPTTPGGGGGGESTSGGSGGGGGAGTGTGGGAGFGFGAGTGAALDLITNATSRRSGGGHNVPPEKELFRICMSLLVALCFDPAHRDAFMEAGLLDHLLTHAVAHSADKKIRRPVARMLALLSEAGGDASPRHQDMAAHGVLDTLLVYLTGTHTEVKADAVLILSNMCVSNAAKEPICQPPLLRALIGYVSQAPEPALRYQMCHIFAELADLASNRSAMVEAGVVHQLVSLLAPSSSNRGKHKAAVREAARAVSNLSTNEPAKEVLLELGALAFLISLSKSAQGLTKMYASATLTNLKHDTAALRIQNGIRGYLGRRQFANAKKRLAAKSAVARGVYADAVGGIISSRGTILVAQQSSGGS